MSEIVEIRGKEFPGFFVIAAITRALGLTDQIATPLEVSFKVNGVELPFTDTINDIYQRMERQIDEEARKIAEEMVTEAGLEGVAKALREVEWKVTEALSKVNVK